MKPDMRVRLCGMELRNPIIAASGTFGYGIEFEKQMPARLPSTGTMLRESSAGPTVAQISRSRSVSE